MTRVQRAAKGEVGTLTLGFIGASVAEDRFAGALRSFRERFPEVRLELLEQTTSQQLTALGAGHIDLGFVRLPVQQGRFRLEVLCTETAVAALPETHPLAETGGPINLRELAEEPFIFFPRPLGPGLYDHLIALCTASGFSPNVVQEAVQMTTISSLVAAGLGVALVPASVQAFGRRGVRYRTLHDPQPPLETAAVWRESTPVLDKLLEVLREAFELPEPTSPPVSRPSPSRPGSGWSSRAFRTVRPR